MSCFALGPMKRRYDPAVMVLLLLVLLCAVGVPRGAHANTETSTFTATQRSNSRLFLALLQNSITYSGFSTWTGDDFCTWTGLTCDGPGFYFRVGANVLAGTLPELTSDIDGTQVPLLYMNISFNPSMTGSLPTSWSVFPTYQSLYASGTGFTGTLPASWSSFTGLLYVYLSSSKVSGTLPPEWSSMTSLKLFDVGSTGVSGTLPPEWSGMTSLTEFEVSNTTISGSLPASWSAMTKLVTLYMHDCALTGTLPPAWKTLTALSTLTLAQTNVTGTLPMNWSTLTALKVLKFSGSKVYGTIPDAWTVMSKLTTVSFGSTDITCCLPWDWMCGRGLTVSGVGMTSAASQSCPTPAVSCTPGAHVYTSACSAYPPTTTTTTTTPDPTTISSTTTTVVPVIDKRAVSGVPTWASVVTVVIGVAILLAALVVGLHCFCGILLCLPCFARRRKPESRWEESRVDDTVSVTDGLSGGNMMRATRRRSSMVSMPTTQALPLTRGRSRSMQSGNVVEMERTSCRSREPEYNSMEPFSE